MSSMRSRLSLPGARPAASVPKPPPPRPRPPAEPPRPAAEAKPGPSPERVRAQLEAQREAAIVHHAGLFDAAERALAERVLAGGTARVGGKHQAAGRHLRRWAELTGRLVWIGDKRWGNPYRPWLAEDRRPTAEELALSHARYREHVLASPALLERLPGLRGRVLACSCPPDAPCHGDVLAGLLEAGAGSTAAPDRR